MKKIIISFALILIASLTLNAHVSLINPNGNERFAPGETVNIRWEVVIPHNTLYWDLMFSSDGGITWEAIQSDIPYETLNYYWTVPEVITSAGRIKIIQDNDGTDYEDESTDFTIATGTAGINPIKDFTLYPNPVTDQLFVQFDQRAEYRILSIIGKQVSVGIISSSLSRIDVSNLDPGIYMLEIAYSGHSLIRKFIKK